MYIWEIFSLKILFPPCQVPPPSTENPDKIYLIGNSEANNQLFGICLSTNYFFICLHSYLKKNKNSCAHGSTVDISTFMTIYIS